MPHVITFGIEKGGTAKTTTCGVLAWLLSQKGYKVLVIDMDSQTSVTQLILGACSVDSCNFTDHNVFDAIRNNDADGNIVALDENLHLLAGVSEFALFPRWLSGSYQGDKSFALKQTIEPVINNYDFILIDTPPSLGDATINALAASTKVICTCETSKYCYSALSSFFQTVKAVKEQINDKLSILGIAFSIVDTNRKRLDVIAMTELIKEEYEGLCFDTIIYRRAAIGRLPLRGFKDNPELKTAVKQFESLLGEVLARCR